MLKEDKTIVDLRAETGARWVTELTLLCVACAFLGIAPTNILSTGLVVATVITLYLRKWRPGPIPGWVVALLFFLGARLMACLLSPNPIQSFKFFAKEWHLLALLPGLTGLVATPSMRSQRLLLLVLAASTALAVAQLSGYSIAFLGVPSAPASLSQTGGFHKLTMTLGGVAMLTLFAPGLLNMRGAIAKAIVGFSVALLLISGARSAWLGALIGAIIWASFVRMPLRKIVMALLLIVLVVVVVPTTRERLNQSLRQIDQMQIHYGSLARRLDLWQAAWTMGNSATFGVGPGRFRDVASTMLTGGRKSLAHAHNVALQQFAEAGWPGILSWAIWNAVMARVLWRRRILPAAQLGLALQFAMLSAGIFEVNQYDAEVATVFYLLIGVALGNCKSETTTPTIGDGQPLIA